MHNYTPRYLGLPAGALGTVCIFRSKGRGIEDQWLPDPSRTRIRNVERKSTDSPKANTKIDVVNAITTLLWILNWAAS